MSLYDDPNRECVGLEPIWTGAEPEEPAAPGSGDGGFNPADHTVAEVTAYLEAHPDEADAIIALEREGKNRTTITGG